MAVVVSYGLTALGGYVMYRNAAGHSEEQLSAAVRFVISPLISLLIGGLVGLLSKSHPIPTCVIGLAPLGSHAPQPEQTRFNFGVGWVASPDSRVRTSRWSADVGICAYYHEDRTHLGLAQDSRSNICGAQLVARSEFPFQQPAWTYGRK
jgi:hypothetical protein